jgi:hypothetical protein
VAGCFIENLQRPPQLLIKPKKVYFDAEKSPFKNKINISIGTMTSNKLSIDTTFGLCLFSLESPFKGIVSRDFGTLFLFHWIDLKVIIGLDQVYFSF